MQCSFDFQLAGPVCVVSITGPYRKGKSFILSEVFDQPDVFPLGHSFVAETMGIWIWIVPEKFRVRRQILFILSFLFPLTLKQNGCQARLFCAWVRCMP